MSGEGVMKQHPILFQDDMVRAILNGSKTQTRRIAKVTTMATKDLNKPFVTPFNSWAPRSVESHLTYCQYRISDQFWVREAWRATETECIWSRPHRSDAKPSELIQTDCTIQYRATQEAHVKSAKWKPSIFMPRWASRIQLKITDIRLERLHDISAEDALAEGLMINADGTYHDYLFGFGSSFNDPRHSYFSLWEKINGKANFYSNPWTWVYEFEQQEKAS